MPQSECDLKSSHLIAALIEMENIVRADEELTAFLELQRAVCIHLLSENLE